MPQKKELQPPSGFIRFLYRTPIRWVLGRLILLLTTTGRKSGLPRITPLQYEFVDGRFVLGSARGLRADWVQNLMAHPQASIQVKNTHTFVRAEVISEPGQIADFLELRLKRHPYMVGMILRREGLSIPPSRAELEAYARYLAMVVLYPETPPNTL